MYSFDLDDITKKTSITFNTYQQSLFEGLCSDKNIILADALRQCGSSFFIAVISAYISTHFYNSRILIISENQAMVHDIGYKTESIINSITNNHKKYGTVQRHNSRDQIRLSNGSCISLRSISSRKTPIAFCNISNQYDFVFYDCINAEKYIDYIMSMMYDVIQNKPTTKFFLFPCHVSRNISEIVNSKEDDSRFIIPRILLSNMENGVRKEISTFYGCLLPINIDGFKDLDEIFVVSSSSFLKVKDYNHYPDSIWM